MAGNEFEWMTSLWGENFEPTFRYPYDAGDGREDFVSGTNVRRVVRGGSFYSDQDGARCAFRLRDDPHNRDHNQGLRVVVAPVSPVSPASGR